MKGDRVGNELVAKYKEVAVALNDEREQIDIDDESDYRALLTEEAVSRVTPTSKDIGRGNGPH